MRLTVRFSPRTHALIKQEADVEGISITQFVREAALARAYSAIGSRDEPLSGEVGDVIAAIRAVLAEEDGRRHKPGA